MKRIKGTKMVCLVLLSVIMMFITGCTRKNVVVKSQENVPNGTKTGTRTEAGSKTGTETETETKNNNYKIYFSDKDAKFLIAEDRIIDKADGKIILEELIKGPDNTELSSVFDKKIVINTVSIENGVATVDFDNSIVNSIAGTTGETMALYSIANTLILNKQLGISQVKLTVNKTPMESLGGHIILTEPIKANLSLIKK